MHSTGRTSRCSLAIAALFTSVALAACGSSSDDNSSSGSKNAKLPAVTKDAKVAAEVPAAIKQKGTLTAAADATYPPNEFIKPGTKTIIGFDADLADALGKVMGVKLNLQNVTFDAIIPGMASKKYDIGLSSFTDTREREKTVDFVTYFEAATSFFGKKQGAPTINSLADLCGHSVAAEKGTTQVDDSTAQGKKCKKAGKPGVKVLAFPDQNGANLAISSGRAEVGMADSPVASYQVQHTGQFKLLGKDYGPFPYGIAMQKGSGLSKPIQDALKALIKSGAYSAILKKWDIERGGIDSPKINAAIS
jgi:polar amino acid transport system substrate-binding protein